MLARYFMEFLMGSDLNNFEAQQKSLSSAGSAPQELAGLILQELQSLKPAMTDFTVINCLSCIFYLHIGIESQL